MCRLLLIAALLLGTAAQAADNTVVLTPGAGVTMRTIDVGSGRQSPLNILGDISGNPIYGTAGTSNAAVVSVQGIASGTALPVSLTSTTITGTVAATQSGTWTVQPGNTANTTPWLITGSGTAGSAATGVVTVQGIASGTVLPVSLTSTTITGTVAATQSGTWNVTNVSGTVSLPTGASTAANQTSVIGTKNAGTAATNSLLAGGVFNSTPLTVTDTQQSSLQVDANGFLKVNVAAGGASGGTSSSFAAAFPATGTAVGMSQGGNMVALTGTSNNLNVQCANCSGSGVSTVDEATFTAGTSLFAGIGGFFQTTATSNALTNGQQGMLQMTAQRAGFVNLRAVGGTEIGTSSAEVFVGGRGTAGSAAGGVLTIQGVASMTKLLVTPDSVALPANQSVNVSQINAVTVLMGNGATGTGSQRVTLANDNTLPTGWASSVAQASTTSGQTGPLAQCAVTTAAPSYTTAQTSPLSCDTTGNLRVVGTGVAQASTTSGQTGSLVMGAVTTAAPSYTTAQTSPLSLDTAGNLRVSTGTVTVTATNLSTNVAQINGVTPLMGNGTTGTGSHRVTLASDGTAISTAGYMSVKIDQTTPGTTNLVALAANQSVNVAQMNGVTTTMGNGVAGTGVQRVAIASDNTAVSGLAIVASGAAPPANVIYNGANTSGATGGLVQGIIQCDSTAIYDASNNGSTELKALTSGRTIYVCGYSILSGGTVNVKLIYGTGTACATGSNNMTPAFQLTAQVGLVDGSPFSRGLKTASANALCINTSAGVAVQAIVYYAVI